MLVVKPAVGERRTKLLFLMGATWFNKSMFDLDTVEDSFAACLNKHGIETYTFDIFGSGPGVKQGIIGNRHSSNIEYALRTVKEHKIDYVLGYSYGCYAARHVANTMPIKGAIFLDPCASLKSSKALFDNDDKFIFRKDAIAKDIADNGGSVDAKILEDHIRSLSDTEYFTTGSYPVKTTGHERAAILNQERMNEVFAKCRTMAVFTKNSVEEVRAMYPNKVFYEDASHWIMIESHRFKLAEEISRFVS